MGASPRFCRDCGTELRPGAQFCTVCGRTAGLGGGPATEISEGSGAAPGPEPTVTSPAVPDHPAGAPSWPAQPQERPRRGDANKSRLLAIGAGAAVAGLAAIVIVAVHPFAQQASPKSAQRPAPALARHSASAPVPGSASVAGSASPSAAAATVSPSPSPSPTQQAAARLAALLAQSVTDRSEVNNAYNDVGNCGPDLAQDVRTFKLAAASRSQLLSQLASMPGRSALPQQMLGDLASAWQASKKVDNDYAAWAQDQVSGGCSASSQSDPHFLAATGPNQQATAGKTAFVQLWNPLAQTYGLTTYQQDEL
jgi:zinc ribbon protein